MPVQAAIQSAQQARIQASAKERKRASTNTSANPIGGMKYLNLAVATGQSDEILSSTAEQIGVWFSLQCYCHGQMNGGCIINCQDWTDDKWCRIAGASGLIIRTDSPLWHWTPMMLVVHLYDSIAEEAYRKKQRMGKIYIERRWSAERERKIIQIGSNGSKKHENKQK